jgi:hypothetical protein
VEGLTQEKPEAAVEASEMVFQCRECAVFVKGVLGGKAVVGSGLSLLPGICFDALHTKATEHSWLAGCFRCQGKTGMRMKSSVDRGVTSFVGEGLQVLERACPMAFPLGIPDISHYNSMSPMSPQPAGDGGGSSLLSLFAWVYRHSDDGTWRYYRHRRNTVSQAHASKYDPQ